jgi:hypothetical protein
MCDLSSNTMPWFLLCSQHQTCWSTWNMHNTIVQLFCVYLKVCSQHILCCSSLDYPRISESHKRRSPGARLA